MVSNKLPQTQTEWIFHIIEPPFSIYQNSKGFLPPLKGFIPTLSGTKKTELIWSGLYDHHVRFWFSGSWSSVLECDFTVVEVEPSDELLEAFVLLIWFRLRFCHSPRQCGVFLISMLDWASGVWLTIWPETSTPAGRCDGLPFNICFLHTVDFFEIRDSKFT